MKKVLIANRGEIAVRIIQSLKELNIQSVAIYSTVDKDSLHVALADESYCIGPAATSESYLDIKKILQVAKASEADAIHPGYGFLAESEEFARACEKEGIIFIGPTADTIELMGDKSQAKATAEENGLPVVPGSDGIVRSRAHAHQVAESIGFPLVVKAVSGGGGRECGSSNILKLLTVSILKQKKKQKMPLETREFISKSLSRMPGISKFKS